MGVDAPEFAGSLKSVHGGHGEIQNNQVGVEFFSLLNGLAAIGCFPAYLQVSASLEAGPQDLANERTIIRNEDLVEHDRPFCPSQAAN